MSGHETGGQTYGPVDYSGARLKLDRGAVHIREVDFTVYQFLRSRPYRIRQIADLDEEKFGYELSLTERPPAILAALLGDAIHNLRAALDVAVCAIAASRRQPISDTYFPFNRDGDKIETTIQKAVGRAGSEAMAVCRQYAPYPEGNEALWGLHRADIVDKHRALIVAAAYGDFRVKLLPTDHRPGGRFDIGVIFLGEEPTFIPGPEGHEFSFPQEIGLSVDIVFPEDGPLAGYHLVDTLRQLHDLVGEIIDEFASRCP